MSAEKIRKAKVKKTGAEIYVYKIHSRGTWCDASDCKTEYSEDQLQILN